MDSSRWNGVRGENSWSEIALLLFLLNKNRFIDNELLDTFSGHQLRMSIVNNFINDLVDEYEILSNTFLIQDSTVISEDFHHSVENVHHKRGGHIELCGCDEEDAKLLRVEIVDALYILSSSDKSEDIITKHGGGSPCQNFTFLKKISLVSLPRSSLTIIHNYITCYENPYSL